MVSGLRRHLPESFFRCSPTAYSPSKIIEIEELLYIQQAPVDPADLSRVATNLRQIPRFLGPSARPVDGGSKGVALCFRPRGHKGRTDHSLFREVRWQFALTSPECFLKGHNERVGWRSLSHGIDDCIMSLDGPGIHVSRSLLGLEEGQNPEKNVF